MSCQTADKCLAPPRQFYGWEPPGSVPTQTICLPHTEHEFCFTESEAIEGKLLVRRAEEKCNARSVYLLTAALMVRDEEAYLLPTLASLRAFCDALVLLDTGSTDDTIALVRNYCTEHNWPLAIVERQWQPFDFAAARNFLLAECAKQCDSEFIFLADAHDEVVGGRSLRALCAHHCVHGRGVGGGMPEELGVAELFGKLPAVSAAEPKWSEREREQARALLPCHYFLTVEFLCASKASASDCAVDVVVQRQPMVRLIRARSGWRYSGPVHEVLWNDWWRYAQKVVVPPEHCKVVQDKRSDGKGSQRRWPRDLSTIDAFLAHNPSHPQALYYRGKTLHALRRYGDAAVAFRARLAAVLAVDDWNKLQRYNAHYLLAKSLYMSEKMRIVEAIDNRAEQCGFLPIVASSIAYHCNAALALRRRVEPLLLRARVALALERPDEALQLTRSALRIELATTIDGAEAHNLSAYCDERYALHAHILHLSNREQSRSEAQKILKLAKKRANGASLPLVDAQLERCFSNAKT